MNTFKLSLIPLIAVFLFAIGGCESTNDPGTTQDPVDTTGTGNQNDTTKDNPIESGVNNDTAEEVVYELTIYNDWSAETHPLDFPPDAHFSHLGGATHNDQVLFWKPGEWVTPGMQEMAESGSVATLVNGEVEKAIQEGNAYSGFLEEIYTPVKPAIAPGSRTTTIEVHRSHHLVTLVTMLGASPDWFVGVSGLSLMKEGKWLKDLQVDLPLYDGGTRDGWIPVMGGPYTYPPAPVSFITYRPGEGYGPATEPHIIGRIVFKRIQ